ncbi:MAG: hypothetical protein NVS4B4_11760 [Bradyrhizobium sp.]
MPRAKRPERATSGVQTAIDYANDVIGGTIPACKYVHLACERFFRDVADAHARASPWQFRPDLAERAIQFAEQLPNIKGPLAGKKLRLMPWQSFVLCNLMGFVEHGTTTRRFRQGVVFVPRGNGKGLALDEEIATPGGFVRMGDVAEGALVLDRDNTPCRVSYASPVHTGLACFEVEFSTGEVIVCDEEHLWLTQDAAEAENGTESVKPVTLVNRHRVRSAHPLPAGTPGHRTIVAVRPCASVPTRCIQVESPSRTYLVGRSFVPTHNTSFAAPIALYVTFLDGEGGAEGYAAAVTRDQARILFDTAQNMVRRSREMEER